MPNLPRAPGTLAVALLAIPAIAGAQSEDDQRAIEEAIAADRRDKDDDKDKDNDKVEDNSPPPADPVTRLVQALNLELSLIFDGALSVFSVREPLQLGGHDPSRTGFTFQQLELHTQAAVDPYFRFETNIVFAPFGVEVEEAFATTASLPWNLQVRAGQFLSRFGRQNPTHPHTWSFADQPLVLGRFFGSEGSRGLGLELSWLTPLPWYVELIGAASDATGECCARSFRGADDPGIDGLEDFLYTTGLRQFLPFGSDWSLQTGISAQFGPNSAGNGNRTEIYGADLYLRWRPVDSPRRTAVSVQLEGLFRTRQVPDEVLQDFGGYVHVVWNIDPRWEIGARYEVVGGERADPLDPEWTRARHRTAVQVTFHPSHFSRLRLQGNFDDPRWRDEPIWAGILALELLAGAHGAHSY
jgi:hypothetical protein